jgi:hypothetical protein
MSSVSAVIGRRAGRIAFGAALLAGMASIVVRSVHGDVRGAGHDLVVTWLAAIAIGAAVRLGVRWSRVFPGGDALLTASLVVPALGLAAVLPLSVHGLWALVTHGNARGFDQWFVLSVRVVGFAHVVFALLFAVHARQLARAERPGVTLGAIYGWTVLASAVPLGMWVLPEVITAVTGLPILVVLHVFDQIAARERTALPVLPRAIVSPCRG